MEKYDKGFILGGNERHDPKETEKKCSQCGNPCFFSDKWDFTKYEILCSSCGLKKLKEGISEKNSEAILHEKTIKSLAKHYGIEEWEANVMARELILEYIGVEPKIVKRNPSLKKVI